MKKFLIIAVSFAAILIAAGYIYGTFFGPYRHISSLEVQQVLAAYEAATPDSASKKSAQPADAETPVKGELMPDRILGNPKAAVTIIEYASLTCPHCGHFHKDTLPQIKSDYIDNGLVKLIFRPFPFDKVALRGSMLAYCLPEGQFYTFIDALYAGQEQWLQSANPDAELNKIARLAGLSEDKIKSCGDGNNGMAEKILRGRAKAEKEMGVSSTPTFLIGAEKIQGAQKFEEFKAVLDKALAQKAQ